MLFLNFFWKWYVLTFLVRVATLSLDEGRVWHFCLRFRKWDFFFLPPSVQILPGCTGFPNKPLCISFKFVNSVCTKWLVGFGFVAEIHQNICTKHSSWILLSYKWIIFMGIFPPPLFSKCRKKVYHLAYLIRHPSDVSVYI